MLCEIQVFTISSAGVMTVAAFRIDQPTDSETIRYLLSILEREYDYLCLRLGLNYYTPDVQVFQRIGDSAFPHPGSESIRQAALNFFTEKRNFWKEQTIEYWDKHYNI